MKIILTVAKLMLNDIEITQSKHTNIISRDDALHSVLDAFIIFSNIP